MSQRQECEGATTLLEPKLAGGPIYLIHSVVDVGCKVVDGKHNTLRIARCTRSVTEHHQCVVWNIGILDIIHRKSVWIATTIVLGHSIHKLGEAITIALEECVVVGNREYRLYLRNSLLVQALPIGVGEEQQAALRVVHDVRDIVRSKGLHNRYNNCTIGDCCDINGTPAWRILSHECNFISLLNTYLVKKDMQLGNLLCEAIVRVSFARKVVGYSRHFAILAERLLVHFNQICV